MNKLTLIFGTLCSISSLSAFSASIGMGAVVQKSNLKIGKNGLEEKLNQDQKKGLFAGRLIAHAFIDNMFGLRVAADIGNDNRKYEIKDSDVLSSDEFNNRIADGIEFVKEQHDIVRNIISAIPQAAISKLPDELKNLLGSPINDLNEDVLKQLLDKCINLVNITSKSNFKISLAPIMQYKLNDKVSLNASFGGIYQHKTMKFNFDNIHLNADKNHYFGVCGHFGVNYNFNSKISIFAEISADKMAPKTINFDLFGMKDSYSVKSSMNFAGSIGISAKL